MSGLEPPLTRIWIIASCSSSSINPLLSFVSTFRNFIPPLMDRSRASLSTIFTGAVDGASDSECDDGVFLAEVLADRVEGRGDGRFCLLAAFPSIPCLTGGGADGVGCWFGGGGALGSNWIWGESSPSA